MRAGLGHPHRGRRDQPLPPGQRRAARRRGSPPRRRRRFPGRDRGRNFSRDYWGRILPRLDPAVVVPTHYDDFFRPLDRELALVTGAKLGELEGEISAVSADARRRPAAAGWTTNRNFLTHQVSVSSDRGTEVKTIYQRGNRMNRGSWVSAALLALVAVLACVPASAMAKSKTLTVCKHGCQLHDPGRVDKAKKNYTINVKRGPTRRASSPQGHKYEAWPDDPGDQEGRLEGDPAGQERQGPDGQPPTMASRPSRLDGVTFKNMTAKNYLANGFHVVDCNGYLMDNLSPSTTAPTASSPSTASAARCRNSVGSGQATPPTSRRDAVPGQAEEDHPAEPRRARERARVLGHEAKYGTIQNSAFYNNGVGVVRTLSSTASASSRPRTA